MDIPDAGVNIHPGAGEHCFDGIDNDCDGYADCQDMLCQGLVECYCPYYEEERAHLIPGGQVDCSLCFDGADNDCDDGVDWHGDAGCSACAPSPVVLDVNGDGFRLTSRSGGVEFDVDGDGRKERVSWVAAGDDPLLALDRNGNGRIDDGRELFGNFTPEPEPPAGKERNGFLALAEYDKAGRGGNGDGLINSRDALFALLRLWRDANHNGVSEPGELHALPALGLTSLELDYKESKRADEFGNQFRYRAKAGHAKGARVSRWAWDVFLVSRQ